MVVLSLQMCKFQWLVLRNTHFTLEFNNLKSIIKFKIILVASK